MRGGMITIHFWRASSTQLNMLDSSDSSWKICFGFSKGLYTMQSSTHLYYFEYISVADSLHVLKHQHSCVVNENPFSTAIGCRVM